MLPLPFYHILQKGKDEEITLASRENKKEGNEERTKVNRFPFLAPETGHNLITSSTRRRKWDKEEKYEREHRNKKESNQESKKVTIPCLALDGGHNLLPDDFKGTLDTPARLV